MRTTVDLPEGLLEEAHSASGFESTSETVVFALRVLVRRQRLEQLKGLMGHVRLEVDIPRSRRRRQTAP